MSAIPLHTADKNVETIKKAEGASHVSGIRWAIVVGVNDYDDERIHDLEFSASDARMVAAALEQSGLYERVYLFADGTADAEPTLKNVLGKIKAVASSAGPDDMILFYFSGHGFPDEKEGHNYLAVKDTDPELLPKFGIGLHEIYRYFDESDARAKVILLDACHSGARKDKGYDTRLSGDFLFNGEGSVTIASSQFDQSSYDWGQKRAGAFTWYLTSGLQGEADAPPYGNGDGLITSHELEQYVTKQVHFWATDHNLNQTPRGRRNMTGDVVLGVAESATQLSVHNVMELCEKYAYEKMVSWAADGIEYSAQNRNDDIEICLHDLHLFSDSPKAAEIEQLFIDGITTACAGKKDSEWYDCHDMTYVELSYRAETIYNESFNDTSGLASAKSCPAGMVYIPPGSFIMGCSSGDEQCEDDEKPAKKVTISRGYCMDIYEVTNRDYAAFLNANGNVCMGNGCVDSEDDWLRLEGSGRSWKVKSGWDNHPMTMVSWYGAKAYCKSLGKKLPSEAQWEFAARAATTTPYYWGSEMNDAYAWHNGNADGRTHPVGQKRANNYGLYDMAGNVWEWVEDCYDSKWYSTMPSRDPVNTCTGSGSRVVRGGSLAISARFTRVSIRDRYLPTITHLIGGFRCSQD